MQTAERTLTSVLGNSQRLDGGAMFGNAPKALWSRWFTPDAENRIPLACRALLLQEPGRTILFETGVGAFFPPKLKERFGVVEADHVLLASLQQIGVSPADIDIVVLSHLHFDHAGGLLNAYSEDKEQSLVFPKARFIVGQKAWERALNPHQRDRASYIEVLPELLQQSGRLEVVNENDNPLGQGFRFHTSDGHTPGMLLTEIDTPEGPLLFAADLIPGTAWLHGAITMGYDRYPEALIDEKTAILSDLMQRSGRVFYTHDPDCAMSGVHQDEAGRFVAVDKHRTVRLSFASS